MIGFTARCSQDLGAEEDIQLDDALQSAGLNSRWPVKTKTKGVNEIQPSPLVEQPHPDYRQDHHHRRRRRRRRRHHHRPHRHRHQHQHQHQQHHQQHHQQQQHQHQQHHQQHHHQQQQHFPHLRHVIINVVFINIACRFLQNDVEWVLRERVAWRFLHRAAVQIRSELASWLNLSSTQGWITVPWGTMLI